MRPPEYLLHPEGRAAASMIRLVINGGSGSYTLNRPPLARC